MKRTILHSDMNNYYASVECLFNPSLRNKPVAVAGNPDARHGIILAKNYEAKKYGVSTGEPLWMARQKCPDIVFTPPNYDRYIQFSQMAHNIYLDYTDQVETFGLDECWLDISSTACLFGNGKEVADKIRERMKMELGLTVSIGVSFNKVFAKLGSDMKKPDATVIIGQDYRDEIWHLPVNTLLYVGKATNVKLLKHGIRTIGDLACTDVHFLKQLLGKNGIMLWTFANGLDTSPVSYYQSPRIIKTIGNSTTTMRDLTCDDDIRIVLYVLCESVAERLRKGRYLCRTVQISIRDNTLHTFQRQKMLSQPSCISSELFEKAYQLYDSNRPSNPIRSLGIRALNLTVYEYSQLSFLREQVRRQNLEALEHAIDSIRQRFGHFAVQRGIMLLDPKLSHFDPIAEHTIYPEAFLKK